MGLVLLHGDNYLVYSGEALRHLDIAAESTMVNMGRLFNSIKKFLSLE
jgi:hypothetical protein